MDPNSRNSFHRLALYNLDYFFTLSWITFLINVINRKTKGFQKLIFTYNSTSPDINKPVYSLLLILHEATSDNLEAISEAASSHSVGSDIENDNLSDMMSANVSGRGTPSISGRDTPLSQVQITLYLYMQNDDWFINVYSMTLLK